MADPAALQKLINDPRFGQLSVADQQGVLGQMDPRFSGISAAEVPQVLSAIRGSASQPQQQQMSPTEIANQALAATGISGGAAPPAGSGINPAQDVQTPAQRFATALGSQLGPRPMVGEPAIYRDASGQVRKILFTSPDNPTVTPGQPPATMGQTYQRIKGGDIAGGLGEATAQAVQLGAPLVAGKAFNAVNTMVSPPMPGPHPQAASNLAAAADVGGKPAGVTAVYEDLAQPGVKAFRDAAAREGIPPQKFNGREGYDAAIQVANRMQNDAAAQFQPYLDQVSGNYIRPSMAARIRAQLTPIMDGLPVKLQDAVNNATTVGDLNDIRMELNKGGGRFFNAATDTQFSSPESQRAMADAGNVLRNEVYGEIQNATGADVRPIKQMEGNAINLRTQFEKARPILSKIADQAEAPPTYLQQLRSGKTAFETAKSAIPMQSLQPPNALEIFNTRMQRAVRGGTATPVPIASFPSPAGVPSTPTGLPPQTIQAPAPQYPQLPQQASPYNFGQTEIRPSPVPSAPLGLPQNVPGYTSGVPSPPSVTPPGYQLPQQASPYNFGQTEIRGTPYPAPSAGTPTSSTQLGGFRVGGGPAIESEGAQPLSLREQLKTAAKRRR